MSVFSNHWIQMPMENVMNWILMMIMMVGKMTVIASRETLWSGWILIRTVLVITPTQMMIMMVGLTQRKLNVALGL